MITSGSATITIPTTTPTLIYSSKGSATQVMLQTQVVDSSGSPLGSAGLVIGGTDINYDVSTGALTGGVQITSMPYTTVAFSGDLYVIPMYGNSSNKVVVSYTAFDN